jgi:hypothetical protein
MREEYAILHADHRKSMKIPTLSARDIAQEVNRRLPTAAARVQTQISSCEICDGQSGTGTGFRRIL